MLFASQARKQPTILFDRPRNRTSSNEAIDTASDTYHFLPHYNPHFFFPSPSSFLPVNKKGKKDTKIPYQYEGEATWGEIQSPHTRRGVYTDLNQTRVKIPLPLASLSPSFSLLPFLRIQFSHNLLSQRRVARVWWTGNDNRRSRVTKYREKECDKRLMFVNNRESAQGSSQCSHSFVCSIVVTFFVVIFVRSKRRKVGPFPPCLFLFW